MPRPSKKASGAHESFSDPNAIARKAYELYQSRGGDHGADLDDWLGDVTGPATAKPRKRKAPAGNGL